MRAIVLFLAILLLFSLFFLSGCTTKQLCGDNLCQDRFSDTNERNPNLTYYCPSDCGTTTQPPNQNNSTTPPNLNNTSSNPPGISPGTQQISIESIDVPVCIKQGTTTIQHTPNEGDTMQTDTCFNSTTLTQHSCVNNQIQTAQVTCPNTCNQETEACE